MDDVLSYNSAENHICHDDDVYAPSISEVLSKAAKNGSSVEKIIQEVNKAQVKLTFYWKPSTYKPNSFKNLYRLGIDVQNGSSESLRRLDQLMKDVVDLSAIANIKIGEKFAIDFRNTTDTTITIDADASDEEIRSYILRQQTGICPDKIEIMFANLVRNKELWDERLTPYFAQREEKLNSSGPNDKYIITTQPSTDSKHEIKGAPNYMMDRLMQDPK